MAKTYAEAGVDVHAGYTAVELMKKHVRKTYNEHVVTDLGSFGGIYALDDETCLVAGCDGVGTKLKAAFVMDRHNTIGIDCVAMCVNDVICSGAKPMFFLDYIATGKLNPKMVEQIVEGIADGCCMAGCALIGGETAEMPGFYKISEYDIAGFCVGMVNRKDIIDGSKIEAGDVLIGLASSGIHSNGFSLVRSVVGMNAHALNSTHYMLDKTLGEELMTPTKIYVNTIMKLKSEFELKGISHITGGGFYENIPRMFRGNLGATIYLSAWEVPSIFKFLMDESGMLDKDAFNTFNMGIGMVLCVAKKDAQAVVNRCCELNEKAYIIGEVAERAGVSLL